MWVSSKGPTGRKFGLLVLAIIFVFVVVSMTPIVQKNDISCVKNQVRIRVCHFVLLFFIIMFQVVTSFRIQTGTSANTAIKAIEFARRGRYDNLNLTILFLPLCNKDRIIQFCLFLSDLCLN